mmetsp:Transcript_135059/g.349974  ORF Transcript_135059/g.349974 Transcript_135059/m.349974 type:complete len:248 (-) Transcript_135059:93-836(-)
MQVHPILEWGELHIPGVSLLYLGLRATLHQHGRKLFHLEFLHNVRVILGHKAKLHGALEDCFAGQSLPNCWRRLLVREQQHLRFRGICGDEAVNILLCDLGGEVRDKAGNLRQHSLGLHLSLVLKGRHRIRGVDHHRGCLLHALLFTEEGPIRATDCANLGHALKVSSHLVILIKEANVRLVVPLEKPQAAHCTIPELRDHPVKVGHCDLLDVMLHGIDLDAGSTRAAKAAKGKRANERPRRRDHRV